MHADWACLTARPLAHVGEFSISPLFDRMRFANLFEALFNINACPRRAARCNPESHLTDIPRRSLTRIRT